MLEAQPAGSLEVFECLAVDPFGRVHRGREWRASHQPREVLVRQYHEVWLEQGLSARRHEVVRNLVHLGDLKPFKGCHAAPDGSPSLVWPYAAGRSLAQALQASEAREQAFGIDQALFLVWALSHHLRHLHRAGFPPGPLSPHRIWISFDGWVQLLDVPAIGILQELAPCVPHAGDQLGPYLRPVISGKVDQNAFQLGALLFELLTHRPLPPDREPAEALAQARLGLPGSGQADIPPGIRSLMERLLGNADPFRNLEELERTLEDSVFDEAFEPSTFGLAFAMQSLFRDELATSALPQEVLPEPAPEPPLPVARTAAFPLRKLGLVAAALAAAGLGVRFGAQAFTRREPDLRSAGGVGVPTAPPARRIPGPIAADAPAPEPSGRMPAPRGPSLPAVQTGRTQTPLSPGPRPVKLRVFVDESGRVRQVHLLSGAESGSQRERAASALAMARVFPPAQAGDSASRSWEEITVMVP